MERFHGFEIDHRYAEGLPEAVQGLYAKTDDGKFRLGVEGIEDTTGLKTALQKEREAKEVAARGLKELTEKWGDLDSDVVKDLIAKFEGNEESKLIREGKIDLVLQKRTEAMRKELLKQVEDAKKETEKQAQKANRWTRLVLDNMVRQAGIKAGVHASGIEDALLHAPLAGFEVTDEGEAVCKRDGNVVLGKDGKTSMSLLDWFESRKEISPHWFPAPSGSDSQQNQNTGNNGGGGGKTIKRADFDKLDPKVKMDKIKEGVRPV